MIMGSRINIVWWYSSSTSQKEYRLIQFVQACSNHVWFIFNNVHVNTTVIQDNVLVIGDVWCLKLKVGRMMVAGKSFYTDVQKVGVMFEMLVSRKEKLSHRRSLYSLRGFQNFRTFKQIDRSHSFESQNGDVSQRHPAEGSTVLLCIAELVYWS